MGVFLLLIAIGFVMVGIPILAGLLAGSIGQSFGFSFWPSVLVGGLLVFAFIWGHTFVWEPLRKSWRERRGSKP